MGTAGPSSPLQVQRLKEQHKLIPLFLVGMSTVRSGHGRDLRVGRAPAPPLLGRVLVLAGSAPYEGGSWCLSCTRLEAQLHYLAVDRQPVCGCCMFSGGMDNGLLPLCLSWPRQPWQALVDGHLMCTAVTQERQQGSRTPRNHLCPLCQLQTGHRAPSGQHQDTGSTSGGRREGKGSCCFRAREIQSLDERDKESPTGFISCLSSPAHPRSPSSGQIRAQAAAVFLVLLVLLSPFTL